MLNSARRTLGAARAAGLAARTAQVCRWDTARLSELQDRRTREIVRYAARHVPYWAQTLRTAGLEPGDIRTAADIARLPVLETGELRENPEQFRSPEFSREDIDELTSSGSSGIAPTTVWRDQHTLLLALARGEYERSIYAGLAGEGYPSSLLRELMGRGVPWVSGLADRRGEHRRLSAFFFRLPHRAGTQREEWSKHVLMPSASANHHFFQAHNPIEEARQAFDEVRPRIVFSFGSWADLYLRDAVHRASPGWMPRVWVFLGDGVSASGREAAERLGVRLWSGYSAIEADRIGFECEHGGGYHVYSDACHVRVVDAEGRDLPPGAAGDIVVSNLINRATVILNYRIGDIGTMSPDPCPCGRALPVIKNLLGRRSELIRLSDGREIPAGLLEGIFLAELESAVRSQMVQDDSGGLRLRVVPGPGVDHAQLRAALLARGANDLPGNELHVEIESEVAPAASGKLRRAQPAAVPA